MTSRIKISSATDSNSNQFWAKRSMVQLRSTRGEGPSEISYNKVQNLRDASLSKYFSMFFNELTSAEYIETRIIDCHLLPPAGFLNVGG